MRGEVEIWSGDELILKEPNMIVDGAGELLADIMTVSRSLSGVQYTATSAILDASNYRIQAISFGTGKDAYEQNAHAFDSTKELISSNRASLLNISGVIPAITFISSIENYSGAGGTLCIPPKVGLPVPPDPMLTVLEPNIKMSAKVGGIFVSSVFPPNGQLTNFMPSAIFSSMMQNTVFSSTVSAVAVASLLGCFPDASGKLPVGSSYHKEYIRRGGNSPTPYVTDAIVPVIGGYFNSASSMDVSGFVNMIMSGVPAGSYLMSSVASGLCMSANSNFSSNGVIEYSVALASGDVGFANMYGGIYHLGLWTIDMQRTLQSGNTPPFAFRQLNNPRKYKLFCRKGLSKNLGFIEGSNGDYYNKNLTIKWRLKFL